MSEEFKDITIDQLAGMMNTSFEDLKVQLNTKVDGLRNEIIPRLDKVETRLETIDERLERIEDVMIRDDRKRIERLEDKMLQVGVLLGKKL